MRWSTTWKSSVEHELLCLPNDLTASRLSGELLPALKPSESCLARGRWSWEDEVKFEVARRSSFPSSSTICRVSNGSFNTSTPTDKVASPQYRRRAFCSSTATDLRQSVWPSHIAQRPTSSVTDARRGFSTSPCLLKKGGKAAREEKQAAPKDSGKSAGGDDPFDFLALEADIASAIERLKNDLSKLRAGGRFNPEILENLRVQPDKSNNQTVKLSDVAQVIPKGRTVQIMVGEKDVREDQTVCCMSNPGLTSVTARETRLLRYPIVNPFPYTSARPNRCQPAPSGS